MHKSAGDEDVCVSDHRRSVPLHISRAIAEAFGPDVRAVEVEELAHLRGAVARVTVDPARADVGGTVIVKRRDPDSDLRMFASTNLGTEVAALSLLEEAREDIAPRMIAGGTDDEYLVLTDGRDTVESFLLGDDFNAAVSALKALAVVAARLHRLEHAPGAFAGIGTWTIDARDDEWHALVEACRHLHTPPPAPAAIAEREELVGRLQAPEVAVLVHGDLVPNNAVIDAKGTCRLIDFEGAGYRHIGLDAAMLRFPFAWYGKWAPVPPGVQQAIESAYRSELGWPDERVDDALTIGCLVMALLRLERLPLIGNDNQPPDMALRRRSQIAATLDTAVHAASGRFDALALWLSDIADEARRRWRDASEVLPTYPALRER